ncbi:MAG: ABC transporter substrate-binding protein, partial [Thermomicrobiales bacterium]
QTFSFSLATNSSDPIRETYAGLLRDAWAKVGINVTVVSEKWSTFVDRVTRTHDFDAFVAGYISEVDPDLSPLFSIDAAKSGLNAGRYLNTEVDSMLSKARSIYKPEQQAERKDLYTKIQQRIMTDLPILPLDFSKNTVAVRD